MASIVTAVNKVFATADPTFVSTVFPKDVYACATTSTAKPPPPVVAARPPPPQPANMTPAVSFCNIVTPVTYFGFELPRVFCNYYNYTSDLQDIDVSACA